MPNLHRNVYRRFCGIHCVSLQYAIRWHENQKELLVAEFGWLFANIFIPYLFPLAVIKFLQLCRLDLKPEQHSRMRLTYLLREGQLSVGSIAIAAAALYELLSKPNAINGLLGIALLVCVGLLVIANSILFVIGTVIGSPEPADAVQPTTTVKQWAAAYPIATISIVLAAIGSVAAFVAHTHVESHKTGPTEKVEKVQNKAMNAVPATQDKANDSERK
jgi:hypothetical protein